MLLNVFKKEEVKETWLFFKRWFSNPRQLGALFPSSKALAKAMASCALDALDPQDWILELGPGTGRFTKALIDAGIPEERLICVEIDPNLCAYLAKRFPKALVILGNACHLDKLMVDHAEKQIGSVISGLPMLNFPFLVQQEILRGCFQVMKHQGRFLQFTYSPFSSLNTSRLQLHKQRCQWVFTNVPPASIWSYTKKASA